MQACLRTGLCGLGKSFDLQLDDPNKNPKQREYEEGGKMGLKKLQAMDQAAFSGGLFTLTLALAASQSFGQTAATLKEAAEKAGLHIGVATNSFNVNNSNYATIVRNQFNMVVCENEMKFQSTEPSRGNFSYNGGNTVATYATTNNMKLRGHTLVWHSQSGWASSFNGSRTEMQSIMKTHIDNVAGHFKGKVYEWDVLNEITADGAGNGLRTSFWQQRIGNDYVDSAFVWTQRVDPNAYLYYNDYGADGLNGKSNAIFALTQRLLTDKRPIHGIGLQAHLSRGLNANSIRDNIKRFGDIGIRISLTEIDIANNGTVQDWVGLMNACLANYNCVAFMAWGLADGNSWIGSNCGCLLYSGTYNNNPTPKTEIINGLIQALNNADPAIVAKRKEFIARAPLATGGVGPAVHINHSNRAVTHRNLLNAAAKVGVSPVFSVQSGKSADALGRKVMVRSKAASATLNTPVP